MSDNLTRTSLNFEFIRRINTDLTPFDMILYFFKNNDNMIVEDPNKCKAYITWKNEIKQYIQLGDMETPWEQTFDGSYIKIKDRQLYQIVPIKHNLELVVKGTTITNKNALYIFRKSAPPKGIHIYYKEIFSSESSGTVDIVQNNIFINILV